MKTSVVIDISLPIPYLTEFWFLSYWPKCCHPVKFRIASNVISQGRSGEVHFWNADKHQSFLQIDTITFGVHSKAYRKYPKNKLVISFQYLKENVKDEGSQKRSKDGLYFFHADKHQCFYNLELLFLIEVASVQSTQNRILVTFSQDLKKKLMQLLLCYTVM